MTILIADDSKSSRNVLRFLIEKQCNADIEEAANGLEALNIIKSKSIDVLITDIKMPLMDGIELIERTEQLNNEIQVIVFSAFADFKFAKKVLQFGAVNYLLKPINAEEFKKTLLEVTNNYELKQKQTVIKQFDEIVINKSEKPEPLPYPLNNFNSLILLQSENNIDRLKIEKLISSHTDEFVLKPCKDDLFILTQCSKSLSHESFESLLQCLSLEYECYLHYGVFENNNSSLKEVYKLIVKRAKEDLFWEKPFGYYFVEKSNTYFADNNDVTPLFQKAHKIGNLIAQGNNDADTETEQLIDDIQSINANSKQCKYIFIELVKTLLSTTESGVSYDSAIEHIIGAEYLSDIKETIELITSDLSLPKNTANDNNTSPIIKKALNIIHNEYASDINRSSIANRIFVSSAYFSHLFKKETGKTFSQYLNEYRLSCACSLLRSSTQSIQSIAKAVGFTNYPYFCSQFKKHYGQTCIQYRELYFKEGD